MTSPAPVFEVAAMTHRGAVRGHNEDTVYVAGRVLAGDLDEPHAARLGAGHHLFVVADGMGGHAHGELASRTAIEALSARGLRLGDETGCRKTLIDVNAEIFHVMERRADAAGMGTTVVGVVVTSDNVVHFNVGDSRAYRHGSGRLVQLSHDDALGAGGGRRRTSHLLTQCLGGAAALRAIEPHIGTRPALAAGEALLLCSDGLTDMVGDDEIAQVLDALPDPGRAAAALFDLAMTAGGADNVSIVIVRAAPNPGGAPDRA
jgi:PPM family protein phosphatase